MARAKGKAKQKEVFRYLPFGMVPKTVPEGLIIVHNHVRPDGFPDVPLGWQGFRAWFATPEKQYIPCDCGWAKERLPGGHYRVDHDQVRGETPT